MAFIAVAFLAVAANVISEHSYDTVSPLSLPPIRVNRLAPETELASEDVSSSQQRFRVALDRFDRITERRVSGDAIPNREVSNAIVQLRAQRDVLLDLLGDRAGERDVKNFKSTVEAHIRSGSELVLAADQTRDLLRAYATRYNDMRARARASIDRAWKVFGRVIARQSIVTLNRQIEELGAAASTTDDAASALDSAGLIAAELAMEKTLLENERNLVASESKEWLASMHEDLAYLRSTRVAVRESSERQRSYADRFAQLKPEVPTLVAAAQPPALPLTGSAKLSSVQTASVAPAPASRVSERKQTVIAWISSGVLLLLIAISVATVRSIVRPVRRLVDATARLAQGDTTIRVTSGGIKELDTLAEAFNSMAEQLAVAEHAKREYQQQLEFKVNERTEQLKHLASNDPLTSLPNHRQLFVMLDQELKQAQTRNAIVGVFFLDIDNFKNINDGMGHAFGDKVLKVMAERLTSIAIPFGFAARLGGDEFVVVMHRATAQQDVQAAGERLVNAFHEPLTVDGRALAVSISVGGSIFPEHGHNAETLLQSADAALFRAKKLGRSQLNMYSGDLLEAASAKFAVEQGLRRALDKDEFELVFQPEFSIESRNVELVEALIRWRQPDGRLASPGEFLSIAEESGLIMEMSDWVLRTAVEAAARWHHGSWPEVRVAINVSSRQLIDSHFVDRVKSLLREHRLPARCIEIELTETVLQTGRLALQSLQQLRAHGIPIALDDFGTGYSSLASLQQLPLTRIKLDRSLINEIDTNPRALAIARSIVGLARNLDLDITAEGIERPEQVALLMREGAMVMQGYLFSRPLPERDVMQNMPSVVHRGRLLLPANGTQRLSRLHPNSATPEATPPVLRNPDRIGGPNLRLI